MNRLAFTLPDFYRLNWTNNAAKELWNPVFQQIRNLWTRLELGTVVAGMRKVGLICIPSEDLVKYEAEVSKNGLCLRTLYSFNSTGYVSDFNRSNVGHQFRMCAVGKVQDVCDAHEAFVSQANAALGRLLGYPSCCIRFFEGIWDREHYIDTTWPMAVASSSISQPTSFEVQAVVRPENNMLLRWLGIRPVFHLPCSFDCNATYDVANEIKSVAKVMGEQDGMDALYDVLGWPVQWSGLHGIAEVETPVLRICTRTDSTAKKYTVRLSGTGGAVTAAAHGNRFPFNPRPLRNVTRRKIEEIPIKVINRSSGNQILTNNWYHSDNGFRSNIDMNRAFSPLVTLIAAANPCSVLHIACKNGALLHKLVQLNIALQVFGVDPDEAKIKRAKILLPNHAANLWSGVLFESAVLERIVPVDVCVLMLGRLLEIPIDRAMSILAVTQKHSRTMFVYAFDDWLKKHTLHGMAAKLGLKLEGVVSSNDCIAAGIVT